MSDQAVVAVAAILSVLAAIAAIVAAVMTTIHRRRAVRAKTTPNALDASWDELRLLRQLASIQASKTGTPVTVDRSTSLRGDFVISTSTTTSKPISYLDAKPYLLGLGDGLVTAYTEAAPGTSSARPLRPDRESR